MQANPVNKAVNMIKNEIQNDKEKIDLKKTIQRNVQKEIAISIPLQGETEAIEINKYEIKIVSFVLRMLKKFFKKKKWFSSPPLLKEENENFELSAKSYNLQSCSVRDVVEDFRFYLRQYFADYGEQVMPAFQYTNQTSLSAMATKLGFRVVKPQNRFKLQYYN